MSEKEDNEHSNDDSPQSNSEKDTSSAQDDTRVSPSNLFDEIETLPPSFFDGIETPPPSVSDGIETPPSSFFDGIETLPPSFFDGIETPPPSFFDEIEIPPPSFFDGIETPPPSSVIGDIEATHSFDKPGKSNGSGYSSDPGDHPQSEVSREIEIFVRQTKLQFSYKRTYETLEAVGGKINKNVLIYMGGQLFNTAAILTAGVPGLAISLFGSSLAIFAFTNSDEEDDKQ